MVQYEVNTFQLLKEFLNFGVVQKGRITCFICLLFLQIAQSTNKTFFSIMHVKAWCRPVL